MTEENKNNIDEGAIQNSSKGGSDMKEGGSKEISEEDKDSIIKPESDEIKKLEEKEHFQLEYYSKEEMLEKVKVLEEELANSKEEIKKLKEETQKTKNKFMHLQAEFENAQKRWDKNRQNLRIEYSASVLKSFLPLYDSFKKALESTNETEKSVLDSFYKQFMNIFKSFGAEPISVKVNDQFDYNIHEALSSIEKDDVPENSIIDIIQEGWKYGKEVIRYAKVIISKKPKPPEPEPIKEEIKESVTEESVPEEEKTEELKREEKKVKEKKPEKHQKDKKKKESK